MMHTTRSRMMNTMMPISSGETAGVWVFDGDEVMFVGGDDGAGVVGEDVGEGVGDAVGDGDGDGVGDAVVGDGVVGEGVGEIVGDGVGAAVVGEGVGEGVGGVFGPEHVTGGLQYPVLRHVGHIAPFVQSGLGERLQAPQLKRSLMAQMPEAAPVIWFFCKYLRMCAQGRRMKGGRAR